MPVSGLLTVDGHELRVTNLDKVLYPATNTTKGDVLSYYGAVASELIAHAHDRIATRKRWPDGVQAESFFEKNCPSHLPEWIETATLEHSKRVITYPLINNTATVLALAQLAALEFHVPQWRTEVGGTQRQLPDRIVFDLDPGPGVGLPECATVALLIREVLADTGLAVFPVTSGSKGMQLYASVLDHPQIAADTSAFAKALAEQLALAVPEQVVTGMAKADRGGKVFIDWSQNNINKTTITPYSLRGREHPNVASPRTWDEISDGANLTQVSYLEQLERLATHGDLLAELP